MSFKKVIQRFHKPYVVIDNRLFFEIKFSTFFSFSYIGFAYCVPNRKFFWSLEKYFLLAKEIL